MDNTGYGGGGDVFLTCEGLEGKFVVPFPTCTLQQKNKKNADSLTSLFLRARDQSTVAQQAETTVDEHCTARTVTQTKVRSDHPLGSGQLVWSSMSYTCYLLKCALFTQSCLLCIAA